MAAAARRAAAVGFAPGAALAGDAAARREQAGRRMTRRRRLRRLAEPSRGGEGDGEKKTRHSLHSVLLSSPPGRTLKNRNINIFEKLESTARNISILVNNAHGAL
jgi:hypothetical protein